jgi:hypothetical protein
MMIGNNDPASDGGGESGVKTDHSDARIPPHLPPPHAQHQITCQQEKHWWDKVKHWAEILGIVLLFIYTLYTIKMYRANKDAADAAKSAADTAKNSLDLTRTMFEASQAAVFVSVFELRTRPEHHPVWITVNMRNAGSTRASNVVGTIKLMRKTVSGKTVQMTERTFNRSVVAANDGITEDIGVNGTWDDLRRYMTEDFQVTLELDFDDGVQRTKQTSCKGPVMQKGTDTGTSFAFAFEDCENIKTKKQYSY